MSVPTISISTQFYNPVSVTVHSQDKITVNSDRDNPVIINGVPIAFRLELERCNPENHRAEISNTGWTFGYTNWTVDPSNWRRMNDVPSASARLKVKTIIIPAVIAALDASPDLIDDAQRETLVRDLQAKANRVIDLREKLEIALNEAQAAELALTEFNTQGVQA